MKGKCLEILGRAVSHKYDKVRFIGRGVNEIISIDAALEHAEEDGLDLVLVGPDAKPPVVRVIDYKKVEYEKKKAKKANKPQTNTLKEIQFKVNISDHDLQTKVSKIRKFLERGDKVKIFVRLKGRERETPERAFDLLDRVASSVECKYTKLPGPASMAILEPLKKNRSNAASSK